jgi:hypothetical protein
MSSLDFSGFGQPSSGNAARFSSTNLESRPLMHSAAVGESDSSELTPGAGKTEHVGSGVGWLVDDIAGFLTDLPVCRPREVESASRDCEIAELNAINPSFAADWALAQQDAPASVP